MTLPTFLQILGILQTLIMGLAAVVGVIVLRSFQAGKFVQANDQKTARIATLTQDVGRRFDEANARMSKLTGMVQELIAEQRVQAAVQKEMRGELDRMWAQIERRRGPRD